MHTTLVDCLCTTKVHKDGSGVEIYYCPVHKAAPELYQEFIVSIERGFALGYSCEDQLELYKKITGEEYDFDSAIAKGE